MVPWTPTRGERGGRGEIGHPDIHLSSLSKRGHRHITSTHGPLIEKHSSHSIREGQGATADSWTMEGEEGRRKERPGAPGGGLKHRERPPRRRNKGLRWQLPGERSSPVEEEMSTQKLSSSWSLGTRLRWWSCELVGKWKHSSQKPLHSLTHSLIYSAQ